MNEDQVLEETAGQLEMVDLDSQSNCDSEDNSDRLYW